MVSTLRRGLCVATVTLIIGSCAAPAYSQTPIAANQHRADLTRTARVIWGMDAPVATFAAQIHQESAWRPDAVSRVGAQGMAQFMPATTKWIATVYPQSLNDAQPFSPAWSMRAMLHYDRWLYQRVSGATQCERMAFVLSSYNGGLGWVQRDAKLAASQGLNPALWFNSVERVNAGRSQANWQENRSYPQRILHKHEPVYVAAGWGAGACT